MGETSGPYGAPVCLFLLREIASIIRQKEKSGPTQKVLKS